MIHKYWVRLKEQKFSFNLPIIPSATEISKFQKVLLHFDKFLYFLLSSSLARHFGKIYMQCIEPKVGFQKVLYILLFVIQKSEFSSGEIF